MSAARDLELADAAARRLARERFDVPVLLEAGAGTGKTRALVERLIAWTLDAGWRDAAPRAAERALRGGRPAAETREIAAEVLDGVVAITFTDAAAAEMASRLGAALAAIARRVAPDEGRETVDRLGVELAAERAAPLAEQLGRARIQTIHAFCRALLAAHPFDAGLHPAFQVDADGLALERVATEVLSIRLAEGLASGREDWIELVTDGHEPEELLDALLAAAERGISAEELAADPFPAERVAERLGEVRRAVAPLAEALAEARPGLRADARAHEIEPLLRALLAALDRPEPLAALTEAAEVADELVARQGETLADWRAGRSTTTIEKRLSARHGSFVDLAGRAETALDRLAGLHPEVLARARRVFAPLLAETRERLRREGFVTFDELLDRAASLLERRADLRSAVRRGIRQLLVDEFQDTDRRQGALVAQIGLDGPPEERPGLFVVGDPKQSIYGWRRADLAEFERFAAAAGGDGALRGRLAMNFRSTPAILAEVERVLAPAFVPEPGLQPPFERLLAAESGVERGALWGGRPAIEYWLSIAAAGAATGAIEATRIEASAVARDLVAERRADPGLAWSDCALLARAASDFEIYLQALREAGIPFAVERDRSYWRRREVVDAAAAVRVVVDPGDQVALVAFLRSPFVGVPDAALAPLWRRRLPALIDALTGPDRSRLEELREILAAVAGDPPRDVPGLADLAGWHESAFLALEALAELRAAFGREPAECFVERLRARLAIEASAAARFLGRFGFANLERFFAELEAALETSGDEPAAIGRFLRRAVREERAAEEARPPDNDADAVRVMTIHRAKGLQFRRVYLLQTHKGRGGDRRPPPFAAEVGASGRLAYSLLGSSTLDWADALARRERVAEREQVRLLYVAMTRARERLVIAGQLFSTRNREGSFLPFLAARLADSPAESWRAAPRSAAPALDPQGVAWRAPGLEAAERAAPPAAVTPPAIDDPVALERDLDEVTRRRAAAATRAARPRLARASGLVPFDDGSPPGRDDRAAEAGRRAALALGSALHRALELAPRAVEDPVGWRAAVDSTLRREDPQAGPAALDAALDALLASRLWKRLAELAPHVLARELPLLLAADPGAAAGPIDGVTGTLDLVYRDPGSGETVVTDFKSDSVATAEEIAAKVELYRPQLAIYGRAVALALAPPAPPRLELWLLALDRVVVVPG